MHTSKLTVIAFEVVSGLALAIGTSAPSYAQQDLYRTAEWKPGERLSQRRTNAVSSRSPSVQTDLEIGAQTEAEILSDPATYPILSRGQAPDAYAMLDRMRGAILGSGELQYASTFHWKIYIINDDKTVNAFATPGGYVYVYTGLIKSLENEAQLAGVMGHEFAHAELRHSVSQMQLNRPQTLTSRLRSDRQRRRAVSALVSAQYSQRHESESDMASIQYLCNSAWDASEFAKFFSGQSGSRAPDTLARTRRMPNVQQPSKTRQAALAVRVVWAQAAIEPWQTPSDQERYHGIRRLFSS